MDIEDNMNNSKKKNQIHLPELNLIALTLSQKKEIKKKKTVCVFRCVSLCVYV